MDAYRGIIRISCKTKSCLRNLRHNVKPECMDCPEAITEILDLEGKVIYEYKSPKIKTGKKLK
ncbi:MAG: hypothetical protein U9N38_06115 [Thermodesulfobacteriota bacterium]|nr:hypothetical protein [Thermodesulfobacteriota bacterium]